MYYRLRPSTHTHTFARIHTLWNCFTEHTLFTGLPHTMQALFFPLSSVCVVWMGVIDDCECESWQFFPVFYLQWKSTWSRGENGERMCAWCSVLISTVFIRIFANWYTRLCHSLEWFFGSIKRCWQIDKRTKRHRLRMQFSKRIYSKLQCVWYLHLKYSLASVNIFFYINTDFSPFPSCSIVHKTVFNGQRKKNVWNVCTVNKLWWLKCTQSTTMKTIDNAFV